MTTGTDMPPALIPSDERFLSGLADTPRDRVRGRRPAGLRDIG